jgi:hypothetical protein
MTESSGARIITHALPLDDAARGFDPVGRKRDD